MARAIQNHPPAKQPETLYWLETYEENEHNHEVLFPKRLEETDEGIVEVDAYSLTDPVKIAFRLSQGQLDWIDAIAHCHNLTRSEAIRRILRAGLTNLVGDLEPVAQQLELEPDQPRKAAKRSASGSPRSSSPLPLAKQTALEIVKC
jgi:hypothetical protein